MKLAFYVGPGTFWDRMVRIATWSRFSHVEMIFGESGGGTWFSSSPRDGGVRFKRILPKPGHWVIVDLPAGVGSNSLNLYGKAVTRIGARYDWLGAFNAIFPWRWQSRKRWFCSELVADLLDLPQPEKWTPERLYQKFTEKE